MGAVTDLRLLEDSGRRVRLGWTGVPSATEYKVTVRNTQGEPEGWGRGWHHLGGTMGTPEGAEAPALLLADGTERTRRVQGSQTALELGDLREGVTYLVRVSALVGGREGSATTLSVRVSKSMLPAPPGLHRGGHGALWGVPVLMPRCRRALQSPRPWAASPSCGWQRPVPASCRSPGGGYQEPGATG